MQNFDKENSIIYESVLIKLFINKNNKLIKNFECINLEEKKMIKNKGMPFYKDSMSHGNLFIEFDVKFPLPGQLTAENKELLQKVHSKMLF